jgi:hypothetical protein
MTRALYFNAGHSPDKWCFAAETAADIYRLTLHSALGISPYEAWYGTKPSIHHLRVCTIYVHVPKPTKSESRVHKGYFMGFTKSRSLIRWLDPSTNTIKHTTAARFDEHYTLLPSKNTLSPGSTLLHNNTPDQLSLPETIIDITDHPQLTQPPFTIHLSLPPLGTPIGCTLASCLWNNLPCISQTTPGSFLAKQLKPHGPANTTFWILSIHSTEFSTAPVIVEYLTSKRHSTLTTTLLCILSKKRQLQDHLLKNIEPSSTK